MLLLAASLSAPWSLHAQETGEPDSIERMGDTPLSSELDLQLSVPQAEKPPEPTEEELRAARLAQQIADHLAAAEKALREGRVDEPPGNNARQHYDAVLALDPANQQAQTGLKIVQRVMVEQARDMGRDLDFELAEQILQDAALVRDDPALIAEVRADILAYRESYTEELEIRTIRAIDAGQFDQSERVLIEMIALGTPEHLVDPLRRRLEEARSYGGLMPGQVIRDEFLGGGVRAPDTVVVLAGSFMMGSADNEPGRKENEGPRHRVTFRRGFAIGRTEVTVGEFGDFIRRTRYRTDAETHGFSTIYNHRSGRLTRRDGVNWKMDYAGETAGPELPVVHVSWNDANAYVRWLAEMTGKPYRLPSEAEFEYALRGGRKSRYWWGEGTPSEVVENLTGQRDESSGKRQWSSYFEGYGDGHWGPGPAGTLLPNPFGLFDISGNVGEWVADCWHDTYMRAPTDGSAWVNPGCKLRVIRGGYWASSPVQARSAFRLSAQPDSRDARIGFRIARDL